MSQQQTIQKGHKAFFIGDTEENAAAKITYRAEAEKVIVVDHTYVSESLRGQGIARELVVHVVDYARQNQIKIIPECPYAIKILEHDEQYQDVLYKGITDNR